LSRPATRCRVRRHAAAPRGAAGGGPSASWPTVLVLLAVRTGQEHRPTLMFMIPMPPTWRAVGGASARRSRPSPAGRPPAWRLDVGRVRVLAPEQHLLREGHRDEGAVVPVVRARKLPLRAQPPTTANSHDRRPAPARPPGGLGRSRAPRRAHHRWTCTPRRRLRPRDGLSHVDAVTVVIGPRAPRGGRSGRAARRSGTRRRRSSARARLGAGTQARGDLLDAEMRMGCGSRTRCSALLAPIAGSGGRVRGHALRGGRFAGEEARMVARPSTPVLTLSDVVKRILGPG
jgi:hypothetical protein